MGSAALLELEERHNVLDEVSENPNKDGDVVEKKESVATGTALLTSDNEDSLSPLISNDENDIQPSNVCLTDDQKENQKLITDKDEETSCKGISSEQTSCNEQNKTIDGIVE